MRTISLMLLAGLSACATNRPTPPSPLASWVGCYELERGPWDSLPEAPLIDLPGNTLRLRSAGAHPPRFYAGPDWPLDRPVYSARVSGEVAAWWVAGPDSIVVVSGELVGITLHLGRRGARATGSAVSFTDILRFDNRGESRRWVTRASIQATPRKC